MALIYTEAELTPGKLELLAAWLPSQSWGGSGEVRRLATFRFDDPAGEVGIETILVEVDGELLQVPLTYRGAPLAGGRLVGEMEHSALGHRWVYDAPSDPVYLDAVRRVIVGGGHEAQQVAADGTALPRGPASAAVTGSGTGSDAEADRTAVAVVRRPLTDRSDGEVVGTLTGTWAGRSEPVVLVRLSQVPA